MSSRSDSQLQNVYELLKNAKPLEAKKELESILSQTSKIQMFYCFEGGNVLGK